MNLQNLQAEIAEAILMLDQTNELVNAPQNMVIYKNNIQSTLRRALRTTYPMINKLVGEEFFQATANDYIATYPSGNGDLNQYGEYFSDFLVAYPPTLSLPYLPEVAKLEWTCHKLSYIADHAPLDIKVLEQIASDQYAHLQFMLTPSCDILKFNYPILRIIALCKNEIAGPIDMNEGGIHLLLHRKHGNVALTTLSVGEYLFLLAIRDNHSLTSALDIALDQDPLFKLDEKLPLWIKNQIIVDCNIVHG